MVSLVPPSCSGHGSWDPATQTCQCHYPYSGRDLFTMDVRDCQVHEGVFIALSLLLMIAALGVVGRCIWVARLFVLGAGERSLEKVLSSKPLHAMMCVAFLLGCFPWALLGAVGGRQYDPGFGIMRVFLAIFCGCFGALLVLDVGLFASLCHSSLLCAFLRLTAVIYPVAAFVGTLSMLPGLLPLIWTEESFVEKCGSAFVLSLAIQVLLCNAILLYFRGHLVRVTMKLREAQNLLGVQEQIRLQSITAKVATAAWTSVLVGFPTMTILLLLRFAPFMEQASYIGFSAVVVLGAAWSGVMSYLFQPPRLEPPEVTGESPELPFMNEYDDSTSRSRSTDRLSSYHSNRSHHDPISVHLPRKGSL